MRHADKLDFNGDSNIGMHIVATDKFAIIGKAVSEKIAQKIENVLKVPLIRSNIYGTPLVGIFIAANSKAILLPAIAFEKEVNEIRNAAGKLGVQVGLLETDKTALSNNICCNDKVAIVSSQFSTKEVEQIQNTLEVRTLQLDLAGMDTPGSAGVITNKGAIFNPNLSEEEIAKVEKLLGFEIGLGTINMGSPIVGSGVVANSNGFLAGSLSSGYEIGRVDESLRLVEA